MSDSKSYFDIVQVAVTFAMLVAIYVNKIDIVESRKTTTKILLVSIAILTSVYWIAGPYSFVDINLEVDYPIAFSQAISREPPGTIFSHSMVGGHDIYAVGPVGGQFVSLERILLVMFPLWLAVALHHGVTVGLWICGSYLLARRAGGANRTLAIALAILSTSASQWASSMTFWLGVPIAITPLAAYVFVFRHGRRHYYPLVIALSALNAIAGSQPQGITGTFTAVVCIALFVSVTRLIRIIPALSIFVGFLLLNWHEALYAMAALTPHSSRAITGEFKFDPPPISVIEDFVTTYWDWLLLILFTVVARLKTLRAGSGGSLSLGWIAFGSLSYVCLPTLMMLIPYETLGIPFMYAFTFRYMHISAAAPALLIIAAIAGAWRPNPAVAAGKAALFGRMGVVTAVILAVGVGKVAWVKSYELSSWLVLGGANGAENSDLRNPEWLPPEPIRVVSLPYHFGDNRLPGLGFDGLVSHFSMSMRLLATYLGAVNGLIRTDEAYDALGAATGTMSLAQAFLPESVAKCCATYDLDERGVNTDLLRIANVGFIVSRLPLTGHGMAKVAGPADTVVPPRTGTPVRQKIETYLHWIVDPPPLFVYSFDHPLPRVFAAGKVVVVPDDVKPYQHHQIIAGEAINRAVVIQQSALGDLGDSPGLVTILKSAPVLNGYDMDVETKDGGIVVLNVAWLPFWHARIDGVEAKVVPVNRIHMAIRVPPGARHVTWRYERPLLRDRLLGKHTHL